MHKHLAFALTLAVVTGFVVPRGGAAEADAAVRAEAQALLNSAGAAFDKKDAQTAADLMLPDASLKYVDGRIAGKAKWLEDSTKDFAGMDSMKSVFTVNQATLDGDTLTVTYAEVHDYSYTADKGHAYHYSGTWRVALKKTDKGWRFGTFEAIAEAITRDGQPWTPPAPAQTPK